MNAYDQALIAMKEDLISKLASKTFLARRSGLSNYGPEDCNIGQIEIGFLGGDYGIMKIRPSDKSGLSGDSIDIAIFDMSSKEYMLYHDIDVDNRHIGQLLYDANYVLTNYFGFSKVETCMPIPQKQ